MTSGTVRVIIVVVALAVIILGWSIVRRQDDLHACLDAESRRDWPLLAKLSEEWTAREPSSADAWWYRGEAAQQMGDLKAASDAFQKVPPSSEKGTAALEALIELQFLALNQPEAAAESCRTLLAQDPDSFLGHQRLIFYYAFTLQRRKLVDQIRLAVSRRREPKEAYVYLFMADSLRLANAGSQLVKWSESNPQSELFQVAEVLHVAETLEGQIPRDDARKAEAIVAAIARRDEKLKDLRDRYPHNLELVAWYTRKAVDHGDAEQVKQLLAEAPPESEFDNRFWRYRGWLLEHFGKLNEAEQAYRQALTLHPMDSATRLLLAGALRRKGMLEEATKAAELASRGSDLRTVLQQLPSVRATPPDLLMKLADYAIDCGDVALGETLQLQIRKHKPTSGAATP